MAVLRQVPAFNLVSQVELERLARIVSLEYFPRGTVVLRQDGPAAVFLFVVKKGGVKLFLNSGAEGDGVVIDYRTEGDYFGLISLVSGDPPRADVVAVEDTLSYLIPRDELLDLLKRNPPANENLLTSYFTHFIDRTYEETRRRFSQSSNGSKDPLAVPVIDVVRSAPVSVVDTTSIRDAAQRMVEHRVSSVVVVAADGVPCGIVTDRDFREKVVADGRDVDHPVRAIMSAPLISVQAAQPCSEALARMMQNGIHHILVAEGERICGVVTDHEFMVLQGSAPTMLVKRIARARSFDELSDTVHDLQRVVAMLSREGAKALQITGIVTDVTEKLLARTAELRERDSGRLSLDYALFVFGAAGRKELTLSGGLELGLAHEETDDPAEIESLRQLIEGIRLPTTPKSAPFAPSLRIATGNVLSVAAWRARFARWAAQPEAGELIPELLEMRSVWGDERMVERSRLELFDLMSRREPLRAAASARALRARPSLGFFRRTVIETSGERSDKLDLVAKGVTPLADAVRIFALEKSCSFRATRKRIAALREVPAVMQVDELEHALDYLLTLTLHHQLAQLESGAAPDDLVELSELAPLERKSVKKAFELSAGLFEQLERRYKSGPVAR